MKDESLPVIVRPANQDDYGYLLASFTRELHKVIPYNFIPNPIFFPYYTKLLNLLLSKSQTLVACIDDNPNDIVGYLIAQPYNQDNIILHWCQTKAIFRRLGVAQVLLESFDHDYQKKNLVCSHYFNLFKQLKNKYNLIFDPTILEGIK